MTEAINPTIAKAIAEGIDGLSESLAPLAKCARSYLKYPSRISEDGVIEIGHRPWVAELNYLLVLYPGVSRESINRYSREFEIHVPGMYADFLTEVNGAFCFGMSLFGITQSWLEGGSRLDRSRLQCHDLALGVTDWAEKYALPRRFFHFGSRDLSESQRAGYFIEGENRILCIAGQDVIGEWAGFTQFLADELPAARQVEEKLHPPRWKS